MVEKRFVGVNYLSEFYLVLTFAYLEFGSWAGATEEVPCNRAGIRFVA